jgi:hypothetical protein
MALDKFRDSIEFIRDDATKYLNTVDSSLDESYEQQKMFKLTRNDNMDKNDNKLQKKYIKEIREINDNIEIGTEYIILLLKQYKIWLTNYIEGILTISYEEFCQYNITDDNENMIFLIHRILKRLISDNKKTYDYKEVLQKLVKNIKEKIHEAKEQITAWESEIRIKDKVKVMKIMGINKLIKTKEIYLEQLYVHEICIGKLLRMNTYRELNVRNLIILTNYC